MGELVSVRAKAVLFDMDGTLVDSTQVVERAWGSWAARHDLSLKDVLSFSHGRPTIATLEYFLPGHDHSEELRELARFEETETEGILAVPGSADVLRALQAQNHPWAVVGLLTTCSSEQLRHWPLIFDFRDVEIQTKGGSLRIELRVQSQIDVDGGMKTGRRS